MRKLSIVIAAAGGPRRMSAHGQRAAIPLGGRETVLSRQVRVLREAYPVAELVVVVGYEADRLLGTLPPCVRVVENELYFETNAARSLGMGLRAAGGDSALLLNGDLVFNEAAVRPPVRTGSWVLVDRSGQMGDGEVGVLAVDGRVTNFEYGLPEKWGQIAMLRHGELRAFRELACGADGRTLCTHEVLNIVLDRGGVLRAASHEGARVAEIDSAADLERARSIA